MQLLRLRAVRTSSWSRICMHTPPDERPPGWAKMITTLSRPWRGAGNLFAVCECKEPAGNLSARGVGNSSFVRKRFCAPVLEIGSWTCLCLLGQGGEIPTADIMSPARRIVGKEVRRLSCVSGIRKDGRFFSSPPCLTIVSPSSWPHARARADPADASSACEIFTRPDGKGIRPAAGGL